MRKRLASILVTGVAVASAAVLTTASAPAPQTWAVDPGGAYEATAEQVVFTNIDSTGDLSVTCSPVTASGTLKSGSGLANPLGTIATTAFENCTGPLNSAFSVTQKGDWSINAESYDGSDVVTGTVTPNRSDGVFAHVTGDVPLLGTCEFDVIGYVDATYTNSTDVLSIKNNPTLELVNVEGSGCSAVGIGNGDRVTFEGDYTLSSDQTITPGN